MLEKNYKTFWFFFVYSYLCGLKTNNRIMATIQEIHALEQRITDIVEDYIQNLYNEDDVLAIGSSLWKDKISVVTNKWVFLV